MSDSFRTDGSRALEGVSDADRDAKIEELLLSGLDHYFAARYEQAINVWTRVLFLDRSHPRARAYIDRARSALAEQLRETEELLHTGVTAFDRGETAEATRLLRAAIDSGAPADEARPLLDRLGRGRAQDAGRPPGGAAATPVEAPPRALAALKTSGSARSRAGLVWLFAAALVAATGVAGYLVAVRDGVDWRTDPRSATYSFPFGGNPPGAARGRASIASARRDDAGPRAFARGGRTPARGAHGARFSLVG